MAKHFNVNLEIVPAATAIPLALFFAYLANVFDFRFGWGSVVASIFLIALLGPWVWLQSPRSTILWLTTVTVLVLFAIPVLMELVKDVYFGNRQRYEYDINLNFAEYLSLIGSSFVIPILFRLATRRRLTAIDSSGTNMKQFGGTGDLAALTVSFAVVFAAFSRAAPERLPDMLRQQCVLNGVVAAVIASVWLLHVTNLARVSLSYLLSVALIAMTWWVGISIRMTDCVQSISGIFSEFWQQLSLVSPSYKLTDAIRAGLIVGAMPTIFALLLGRCGLKVGKED